MTEDILHDTKAKSLLSPRGGSGSAAGGSGGGGVGGGVRSINLFLFVGSMIAWGGFLTMQQTAMCSGNVNFMETTIGKTIQKTTTSLRSPGTLSFSTTSSSSTVSKVRGYDELGTCALPCQERAQARRTKFQGDLLNRSELVEMARKAKAKVMDQLRIDYGEYMESIFLGEGKTFTPVSSPSMDRLKRKLMIKVLSMQTQVLRQDQQATDCDCLGRSNVKQPRRATRQMDGLFEQYIWANGGHSASAGHGNLFNESYTAYLTKDASQVFQAIGIDFVGRNHAMGGATSAPELSMCFEQVYGNDVDFFTWDFGMIDGKHSERLLHYGYRGGISAGRPAFLGVRMGGGSGPTTRVKVLKSLEDIGMAVFLGTDDSYKKRYAAIPDSAGIPVSEIEKLPEYVRNFKCNDKLENGEPFCSTEKYSKLCQPRTKQTSWHPGYKSQAIDGHALGLFIIDALIATLEDLILSNVADPAELLRKLLAEEDQEFERIQQGSLPEEFTSLYAPNGDNNLLWKGPSICRTARLPAQSRFLGHTTNTDKVGGIAVTWQEQYDTGVVMYDVKPNDLFDGTLPLTFELGPRDMECEFIIAPDYDDGCFFAAEGPGWLYMSLPNPKEKEAYSYDPTKVKGVITIVLTQCSNHHCADNDLRDDAFDTRSLEMTVNGEEVEGYVKYGEEGLVLKGAHGIRWKPNAHGTFDIGVKLLAKNSIMRISSIAIF